jgi:hypothetical protein
MKEQTELIEAMKERRAILAHSNKNDFRGCKNNSLINQSLDESSFGMNRTRISQIGRKLIESSTIDERGLPFATKPGFSFGVSTRTVPR